MKTLIVTRSPKKLAPDEEVKFDAHLDDKHLVGPTRQPMADGARQMITQGWAANTLATMRHQGSKHDSFKPATIGQWAGINFVEGDRRSLHIQKYKPFPCSGKGKRRPPGSWVGHTPPTVGHPPPNELRLRRKPPPKPKL